MTAPPGLDDLEAVAANASENALVTLPAAWLCELLAYVRSLESSSRVSTTHISPGTDAAPRA